MARSDGEAAERLRLFVAAEVPHGHRDEVAARIEELKQRFSGARWTTPDNQHVTLKFLGSTPRELVPEIHDACRSVARDHEPATLALSDVGSFPSARRSRVLWLGLDDPKGLLAGLASDLDRALAPLGFATEERGFTPHLTLCRFKVPVKLPDGPPPLDVADLAPFEVSELVLFRSYLSPKGARYEALERFGLGSDGT
ncbi:MAG TPA: RNA 2',3'-cyclic phosphodiesterase [Actinomycetota bacterium]|nr:RNA 2',3'-cyclic phosphodiesterase [Actinomycetota bacterium]